MPKYRAFSKASYAAYRSRRGLTRRELRKAKAVFQARSKREKSQDLVRLARIAPNLEVWVKTPNRLDLPGVDTPDAQLVFEHRSLKSQAADLAKLAKKAPLEVWIKQPNRFDLEGVDTPAKRFKIVEKPKKPEEKETRRKKLLKREGRTPTREEILEKAREMFMEEQARQGLPAITPEEGELKEAGFWEKARDELMRSKSTVDNQVLQYIDLLKDELEPMGFTIVPLEA